MATRTRSSTKTPSTPGVAKAPSKRRLKPAAASIGLTAPEVAGLAPPDEIRALMNHITSVGGAPLAAYREPLGAHWVVLASLPLERIAPTPYQRELSKAHAEKLAAVMPKVGRFLDPVIAVPDGDRFITPNGMHRLAAMTSLGARAIIALVMPEVEIAYRIIALNTEKAHNLRDKALEAVRMAKAFAEDPVRRLQAESEFAFELEQPALVTLGICYLENGRFSGGAYQPVLARCEVFSDKPVGVSLTEREARARLVMELDAAVTEAVARLKEAGFNAGYLKPVVVARINPLRFVKPGTDTPPDFAKTLQKMIDGARAFDASKVRAQDVAMAAAMSGSSDD